MGKKPCTSPKLTHDLKCTQYESKTMLKMMLEKNGYAINVKCSFVVDIFRFCELCKKETQATTYGGKFSSQVGLVGE